MRILVNYQKEDQAYLPILQYHLKQRRLEAIATNMELSIGELLAKAQASNCAAILLCHSGTLKNCVPGDKPTLDAYRGSRLNFSIPVIVCNPISHCHTIDEGTFILERDLDKFKTLEYRSPEFTYEVLDTTGGFQKAVDFLSYCILIAYDIETVTVNEDEEKLEAGETLITCVSWTGMHKDGEVRNYVLPLISFMQEHWTSDFDYEQALDLLRTINSFDIPKVMHNGMYDSLHSIVYHAEPKCWLFDTMAFMHSEFSTMPKSLDFCASLYIPDYIQWKQEAESAAKEKDIQRYWAYNARDTYYTLLLCIHYLRHLPSYARKNYATQFKLVYPFLYCNFEGFRVDQEKRNEMREARVKQQEEALNILRISLADPNFNPGSPKQVQTYIYDIFGANDPHIGFRKDPKTKKKARMTRGTDEKNLLAVGEQHPLLLNLSNSILSYREAQKAIGTYFDFLQKEGRLLYNINPFGTETGRASAQASSFWCGTQIQNIPAYAKPMLVADDGYILAEPDNSQSEARCVAYLAQDTALISALEDPSKDFYKSLGTLLFQMPYETVTTDFRNLVLKKIVHGTNYMMGAATFIINAGLTNILFAASQLGVKVTMEQKPKPGEKTTKMFAAELLESYHTPFNKIRPWYISIKNSISSTKMLVSPLGWTRYFFGDINKKHQIFASAVAHGPQNLSVAILNIGLWKVWGIVKREKGALRLKAQIHDSAPFQYKVDRPELRDEVIKAFNNPVTIHGRVLRIPVDCKEGKNWGDMKKLKRE